MNAVARLATPISVPPSEQVFAAQCEARALLFINGELSLHDAVDELQAYAEDFGLVDRIGQDEAQRIMSEAFAMAEAAPDELNEASEQEIMLRTANLVRQWELDDPRDAWRHTGEHPPRAIESAPTAAQPYRTPESVIQGFWHVVRLDDAERLARWLDQRPRDEKFLCKLWKAKNAAAA
jgi:hypothetical protein